MEIVRHPPTERSEIPRWTLREVFRTGEAVAGDAGAFGQVVDAAMPDSLVFVLDAPAQHVRVFAADGTPRGTIGAPGDGPGELSRFASGLLLGPDSISIVDWGRGRLHHFGRDGAFSHATEIPLGGTRSWWRRGANGALYARTLSRYVDDESRWRGTDLLRRVGPDGSLADTVLTFEYEQSDLGGPGRPVLPLVVNAPTWDVLPDGSVAWASLAEPRVFVHGPSGAPRRIMEMADWQPAAPGPEEQARLLERMGDRLVSLGGSRDALEQLEVLQPERLPAFTSVRSGPGGTLVVQTTGSVDWMHPSSLNTPDPPIGWGGPVWDVFDATGERVAWFRLPPTTRVFRITQGRIVGAVHDDLGREDVVVWTIDTTPAEGPEG